MAMWREVFYMVLFAVAANVHVHAKVFTHEISSDEGFAFIGKFAFDHKAKGNVGTIEIDVEVDEVVFSSAAPLDILLYDDQQKSWPQIYDRGYKPITCEEKRRYAKNWDKASDTVTRPDIYKVKMSEGSKQSVTVGIGEHYNRFWFVALASCESFEKLSVNVTFINEVAGRWNRQFGYDEMNLQGVYLFSAIFFLSLTACALYSTMRIWQTDNYTHHVLKIMLMALCLECLSVCMQCLHFLRYASNGVGLPVTSDLADFVEVSATSIFIFLLLLLAQGWTIKTTRLTGRRLVCGTCACFLCAKWGLLIWEDAIEDPAATYLPTAYKTGLYMVNAAWLCFVLPFLVCLLTSWREEMNDTKRQFFVRLGAVYGPWMLSVPFVTLLTFDLSPYGREKVVRIVHLLFSEVAYAAMVWFMWHSRASEYFDLSVPVFDYDRVQTSPMSHLDEL